MGAHMWAIRAEQVQALEQESYRRFVERLSKHLRADFTKELADQGVAPEEIEEFIHAGIAQARSHGVLLEGDLEYYQELRATLGANFDCDEKHSWAGEILGNEDFSGTEKMDEIEACLGAPDDDTPDPVEED
jgi:hypothetical protein